MDRVGDAAETMRRARDAQAATRSPFAADRHGFYPQWQAPNLERVYLPRSAAEARSHVEEAIGSYGAATKVVSGGHCMEDFVYNPGTRALIDVSQLNGVGYDEERSAFFVDAGSTLENVGAQLQRLGRSLPMGTGRSVAAGGHFAGGGYGPLSRAHGLVIDHITAIDVITWDHVRCRATLRHISNSSADPRERDLFWALRGAGGGNFGVITRYYFDDPPPAPTTVTTWRFTWPWDVLNAARIGNLLAGLAELASTLPEGSFGQLRLRHAAAGSIAVVLNVTEWSPETHPQAHHVRSHTWPRPSAQAEAIVDAVRHQLTTAVGWAPRVTTNPVSTGSRIVRRATTAARSLRRRINPAAPLSPHRNRREKHKSAWVSEPLSEAQVAALIEGLRCVPSGLRNGVMRGCHVQINTLGGAIGRLPAASTAFPHRGSLLSLRYEATWADSPDSGEGFTKPPTSRDAHLQWIRDLYADVHGEINASQVDPADIGDGSESAVANRNRRSELACYFNYPDSDLGTHESGDIEFALNAYFGDNHRRNQRNLGAVKQAWDPTDVFRFAQSIPPR